MASSLRAFAALVAAGMLPLLAFAAIVAIGGEVGLELGLGTLLLTVALLGVLAAALLAPAVAPWLQVRAIRDDLRPPGTEAAPQIELLAERDRQIEELARQVELAPIGSELTAVARHIVATAHSVTGDQTWSLIVVDSTVPSLPAGWYGSQPDEYGALEDLHRWASAAAGSTSIGQTRCHIVDGPWGAFAVIDVRMDDTLRAILLAPWAGRAAPGSAELGMLTLIGQHAAATVEHALLYEQLREQTTELDRLTAIQGDFLRGVTHDLQSPLTSIAALASELSASPLLPESARTDLDVIAHQAGRLRRMVAQLLTVTGLEARAIVPRDEVFRLEPIVRRVWTSLRSDRPFTLRVKGPDRLVAGDPDRIEQVVWALFDNALKYSPSGSAITVELVAVPEAKGGIVECLRIRDEGVGMDAETARHAFDRFYRAPAARRMAPDGSGIGLYTAAGLVELMGGGISAESSPGRGTTIVVTLPAERADAAAEPAASGTKVLP